MLPVELHSKKPTLNGHFVKEKKMMVYVEVPPSSSKNGSDTSY